MAIITFGNADIKYFENETLALATQIRLPFRLRVGRQFRLAFDWKGSSFEIIARNVVDIPRGTEFRQALQMLPEPRGTEGLFTNCLIINKSPSISSQQLQTLQALIAEGNSREADRRSRELHNRDATLSALNAFIVAYARIVGIPWGGTPLSTITSNQLMAYSSLTTPLLVIPINYSLTDDDINSVIFTIRHAFIHDQPGGLTGYLDDVDLEGFSENLMFALAEQQIHSFFESSFDADARMIASEFDKALLLRVIALEGVVGALVRKTLRSRLIAMGNTHRQAEKIIKDYLHEQGITLMMEIVPATLMSSEHSLTREEIKACIRGLSVRNKLIHGWAPESSPEEQSRRIQTIKRSEKAVRGVYGRYLVALEVLDE